MIFNCLTIFPEMFSRVYGNKAYAKRRSLSADRNPTPLTSATIRKINITASTHSFWRWSRGLLLMPQPLFSCFGIDGAVRREKNA